MTTALSLAQLQQRHAALLQERAPWDEAWRQVGKHFLPTRRHAGNKQNRSAPMLNPDIVDSTGILALRTLAAGLQGGLTSPARPWFRLALDGKATGLSRSTRLWLDQVTERMRMVLQRSNFYNAMHLLYTELGAFGTGAVFALADVQQGFRFLPLTAGSYALECNEREQVDTLFRKTYMTARQLMLAFGEAVLPEHLRAMRMGSATERHCVIHAVLPRAQGQQANTSTALPYASLCWLEGREGQMLPLKQSGFWGFPAFTPRWDVAENDVYGHSPCMDALPDCRMVQQMGISTLKAIHKSVDPPMSVSASLKAVGLDLTPGGINYVETLPGQNPQAASPLLAGSPDIGQARQAIETVQKQIQAGLHNDLFRMLLQGSKTMTATEVAAREEEKLILIGPVLERLHHELFMPLIDRIFLLMRRLDMLPPCPPELLGRPVKVEFISLLAQAQQLVSTGAIDKYCQFVATAGQCWPEALDALDVDSVMDTYADHLGLDVALLRPHEERLARRAVRLCAAQAQ
jgi:hypothetical protein